MMDAMVYNYRGTSKIWTGYIIRISFLIFPMYEPRIFLCKYRSRERRNPSVNRWYGNYRECESGWTNFVKYHRQSRLKWSVFSVFLHENICSVVPVFMGITDEPHLDKSGVGDDCRSSSVVLTARSMSSQEFMSNIRWNSMAGSFISSFDKMEKKFL